MNDRYWWNHDQAFYQYDQKFEVDPVGSLHGRQMLLEERIVFVEMFPKVCLFTVCVVGAHGTHAGSGRCCKAFLLMTAPASKMPVCRVRTSSLTNSLSTGKFEKRFLKKNCFCDTSKMCQLPRLSLTWLSRFRQSKGMCVFNKLSSLYKFRILWLQ